jgi:transketolase
MAMGAKQLGKEDIRVYCMVGDGECQEGQVWEAAMVAERYGLDNLVVLVDFNKVQQFGGWRERVPGKRVPTFEADDLPARWRAFGWRVLEIDGHDFTDILEALARAKEAAGSGIPTCVVAHTVKGKGVSFMEHTTEWHAKVPGEAELRAALAELGEGGEKVA